MRNESFFSAPQLKRDSLDSGSNLVSVPVSRANRAVQGRLLLALGAVVLATTVVAIVAIVRTGWSRSPMSLARIVILILLAVLVLRGIRWARWVLIAWLSFAAITFIAFSIAVATSPPGILLFVGMIAVYIWAVVELSLADIA